jgi:hypothetical protein
MTDIININPIIRYFKFTHKGKSYTIKRIGASWQNVTHEIKIKHIGYILSFASPHGCDDVINMFIKHNR